MDNYQRGRGLDILLVEDNPGDVRLTQEALRGVDVPHRLHVARDGMEALAFLNREEGFREAPVPDLILLDLNLPRLGGREVLGNIKTSPEFRHIPVVVVTTSEAAHDVMGAYSGMANCYVSKPMDLDRFMHVVQNVVGFFSSVASLPVH
ncbi:MAG: response regulator [Alphaproteobacteria bacterium]